MPRAGDRAFAPRASTAAAYVDAGSSILNGQMFALAFQCDAGTVAQTESPRQNIIEGRTTAAYCTQTTDAGLMNLVLMPASAARLERVGYRIEPSAVNLIGASGAAARDLTAAGWTASNMTCTLTATGADGAANSASHCVATTSNATITYAVTVASTKRSSSMLLKASTVTGAVTVTRNNFATGTNVGASLSTSSYKRIWAQCGGGGDDLRFSSVDNCIAASNMTATAANPTVGLKLATSGDSVDIDMVQDEATDYPTSPMFGFDRALDKPSVASTASLPIASGEVSLDWMPQRGSAAGFPDPGNFLVLLTSTTLGANKSGITLWANTDTGGIGAYIRSQAASTQLGPTAGTNIAGQGRNHRVSWGGGTAIHWEDGLATNVNAIANMPDVQHSGAYTLGQYLADETDELGGWITRVRWTAGALSDFHGASIVVYLIGDSIVAANAVAEGSAPTQIFSSLLGGGRPLDQYGHNYGVSGQLIDDCIISARARITEAVARDQKSQTVIVFQCGQNSEAQGDTVVFGKIKSLWQDGIDAGVRIMPSTLTPYVDKVAFVDGVNWRLRALAADAGYVLAESFRPMESPPDSGVCGFCTDGQHPTSAGSVIESTAWFNAGRAAGWY